MKKSLFMLGAAIVALSSCTQDEVLNVNENRVISFESHVNKSTRAVTNTNSSLSTFYLIGGFKAAAYNNVFDNVPVTYTSGAWNYGSAVVWTENQYYFGAYADKNSSGKKDNVSLSYDATNGATLTFTQETTDNAKDLVAAVAAQHGGENTAQVNLNFNHVLSKIMFTFDNTDANYKMTVSNIEVVVKDKADCTYSAAGTTWTAPTDDETLTFAGKADIAADATLDGKDYVSEDHLVIPGQTTANIYASFTVTFKDAEGNVVDTKEYTGTEAVSLGTAAKWDAGYIYNYTASLSAKTNVISFSATVADWEVSNAATPSIK